MKKMEGRYLVHNTGTELFLVGGPYSKRKKLGAALVEFLRQKDFDVDDAMHVMHIGRTGDICFSGISNRFIEAAKFLACPDDPEWSWWEGTEDDARNTVDGQ